MVKTSEIKVTISICNCSK